MGGIACLALALGSPAAPVGSQASGGTIVGTVVDAASGDPIEGVRITRIELAGAGRQVETISDDRGRFAFTAVGTGRWRVVGELSAYESGANDRRRPNGPDRPVVVSPGSHTTVAIRMFRSYGSLCGVVVDDVNQAAVGIAVNAAVVFGAHPSAESRTYAMSSGAAATDDTGRFCLSVPPGSYAVVIPPVTVTTLRSDHVGKETPGGSQVQRPLQRPSTPLLRIGDFDVFLGSQNRIGLLPPTSTSARLDSVYDLAVHPSESASVMHIVVGGQVTSAGEIFIRRASAHTVSGRIVGPTGPVPDANVRVIPRAFATSTEGTLDIAATLTDSSGSFTLFGIPAGQFVLRAAAGPVGTGWAETALAVGDSDLHDVAIELRPGVRASGRVVLKGNAPATSDLLARVSVALVSVDAQLRGAVSTRPASDGSFKTADYPPGRYLLSVTAPAGWVLESAIHERQDIALTPVTLSPDESAGVTITLTDRPATLTGHVRALTGAADSSATVLLFPVGYHIRYGSGSPAQLFREARVATDGSFEFRTLAPAEYFVIAIDDAAADGWRAAASVPRLASVAERIRLGAGDQLTRELRTQTVRRLP